MSDVPAALSGPTVAREQTDSIFVQLSRIRKWRHPRALLRFMRGVVHNAGANIDLLRPPSPLSLLLRGIFPLCHCCCCSTKRYPRKSWISSSRCSTPRATARSIPRSTGNSSRSPPAFSAATGEPWRRRRAAFSLRGVERWARPRPRLFRRVVGTLPFLFYSPVVDDD